MKDTVLPIDPVFDPLEDIRAKDFNEATKHPYLFVYLEDGNCFLLSFKQDDLTNEYMIIRKHLYYKQKGKLFKKKLGRIVGCSLMHVES